MDTFKEFEAQSLDDAILAACEFYDAPREKLEIEIVNDAKNGIFGLVGAKKACVRARRVNARGMSQFADDATETNTQPSGKANRAVTESKPRSERGANKGKASVSTKDGNAKPKERVQPTRDERKQPVRQAPAPTPPVPTQNFDDSIDDDMQPPNVDNGYDGPTMFEEASSVARQGQRAQAPKPKAPRHQQSAPKLSPGSSATTSSDGLSDEPSIESICDAEFEKLDKVVLLETATTIANKLILPIAEDAVVTVEIVKLRVRIHIDCGDDSGIIIGREGQTLAALQYIIARLVSRAMGTSVRLQMDVGDYRMRQDERLREMALSLAERVRANGKAYSTRPMSSYHRRIIHLTLQNEADLQTRSYGEGSLKHVLVCRKREKA